MSAGQVAAELNEWSNCRFENDLSAKTAMSHLDMNDRMTRTKHPWDDDRHTNVNGRDRLYSSFVYYPLQTTKPTTLQIDAKRIRESFTQLNENTEENRWLQQRPYGGHRHAK